jgi:hypothetical protein
MYSLLSALVEVACHGDYLSAQEAGGALGAAGLCPII